MNTWLLTIRTRQDGAAMEFTLREAAGQGDALDVERAVLRADQDTVATLLDRLYAEADRPRPRDLLASVAQLGDTLASRLVPRGIVEALDEICAEPSLLTIESNEATIPWELTRVAGQPLSAHFGVARRLLRSSPSRRLSSPASAGPFSALVIADPEGNLPWVDEETGALDTLLRQECGAHLRLLKGEAATAGGVMDALEQEAFTVVHFSCHTSHDAHDAGRSLVYLHDEPVPASRLFDVRLPARPLLVFVNACQAARGGAGRRGQHDGLAASFLDLGIQAFVGPLWPVSDRVSARLSVLFYEALLSGSPVGEAMRRARLACAAKASDDPLASWASYVVYGNAATSCAPLPSRSEPGPSSRPASLPEERSPPSRPAESGNASRFSLLSWLGRGTPPPSKPAMPDPDRTSVWSVRRWELEVTEGNHAGMRYELCHKDIRIGRSEQAGQESERLGVADKTVSREQATLTWDARQETYVIEHARTATNQTFVNDTPLKKKHSLASGDRIRMGSTCLAFVPARPPRPLPLPPREEDSTETTVRPAPPAAHVPDVRRGGGGSRPAPLSASAPQAADTVVQDQTDAWRFRPSFHLAVLSGPDQGRTIALASSTFLEGRVISMGRRGQRNNEITLGDAFVSNTQASLECSRGRFWLNNDCGDPSLKINGSTVSSRAALSVGDTIHMGRTLMVFRKGEPRNAAPEERYAIEVSGGPLAGKVFILAGEATRIGRSEGNGIVLPGRSISQHHATIILRGGRHFLVHESRKNPTLVNGVEVSRERHLEHGDEIQVSGDTTLRFVDREMEVFGP